MGEQQNIKTSMAMKKTKKKTLAFLETGKVFRFVTTNCAERLPTQNILKNKLGITCNLKEATFSCVNAYWFLKKTNLSCDKSKQK